jgi:hypothetical protein
MIRESADGRRLALRPTAKGARLFVCAECRYAQLFAVQPRALCTLDCSYHGGRVLFAGQPACARFAPRQVSDPQAARCSRDVMVLDRHLPLSRRS